MAPKKDLKETEASKPKKKAADPGPADKGCEYIRAQEYQNLENLINENIKVINKLDIKFGLNMLHTAVQEGHQTYVDLLLGYGAKINYRTRDNETAAMIAAYSKEDDILKFLMKKSANITLQGRQGDTALHIAARRGHLSTTELLLNKLTSIEQAQKRAEEAAEAARVEAERLAELARQKRLRNAARNADDDDDDDDESSAAPSHGNITADDPNNTMISPTLQEGVAPVDGVPAVSTLPNDGAPPGVEGEEEEGEGGEGEEGSLVGSLDGSVEDNEAAFGRKLKVLEELEVKNDLAETPLANAIKMQVWTVADLLIKFGADINTVGLNGNTPMLRSAYDGRLDSMKYCLKQPQCNRNAKNLNQETALLIAIKQKHFPVAEYLVSEGFSAEDRDELGNNILLCGAMINHMPTIKFAVEVGKADVNAANNWGTTAAMYASKNKYGKMSLEYLVARGCDLNLQDRNHRTCLMFAANLDDIKRMIYLLENGADPTLKDIHSKTALQHIPDHNVINERGNIELHDENVREYVTALNTYTEKIEFEAGVDMMNIRGAIKFKEGEDVEVNYKGRGKWHRGKIARVCLGAAKGTFDIAFDVPQLGVKPSLHPPRARPEWMDRQVVYEKTEKHNIAWDAWVKRVYDETAEIAKQEARQILDEARQLQMEAEENARKEAEWNALTDEEREVILRRRAKEAAKAKQQAREEAIARGEDPDALEEAAKKKELSRKAAANRAKVAKGKKVKAT